MPEFFDKVQAAIDRAASDREINTALAAVAAAEAYVRQVAKGNTDLLQRARALRIDAQVRLGQIAPDMPKATGTRGILQPGMDRPGGHPGGPPGRVLQRSERESVGYAGSPPPYKERGFTKQQIHEAKKLAALPVETLEAVKAGTIPIKRAIATPKAEVEAEKKPVTEADRLRARVKSLEAEVTALTERNERLEIELTNAQDSVETLQESLKNCEAIAGGEEAKRLESLAAKWRASEASKNGLMSENADLKRRVRSLMSENDRLKRAVR
ncbi:MAG: hypothetical protein AB7G13_28660 [Lautropia sp.]